MQTEHSKHSQPGRLQVNLVVVGRGAESDQIMEMGLFFICRKPKGKGNNPRIESCCCAIIRSLTALRKCWWFPSDFLSSRGVPTLTAIVCLQCLLHPTRSSANATKPKENAVNDQLHSWNQTILLSAICILKTVLLVCRNSRGCVPW